MESALELARLLLRVSLVSLPLFKRDQDGLFEGMVPWIPQFLAT
jgi:hypothetical protein